ncbi:hypothetical protein [Anaerolinea sp.]|uniref:hypothetical protein n=1 Tax=Anaerolinea sp. TaxID=1872519 RepID=UPI002ACDC492|nr:hypothetical protein [Anaerolinea sp.]
MKRWSVLVLLAGVVIALLIAGELLKPQDSEDVPGVRLTTRTPTVTRTAGWWEQVSTWTPTPTGEGTQTPEEKPAERSTPTPELNLPPVKTMIPPTKDGGQP